MKTYLTLLLFIPVLSFFTGLSIIGTVFVIKLIWETIKDMKYWF